jgi:hypothetical protein
MTKEREIMVSSLANAKSAGGGVGPVFSTYPQHGTAGDGTVFSRQRRSKGQDEGSKEERK